MRDGHFPRRRHLGQQLRQVIPLGKAVADEQDVDRARRLGLGHRALISWLVTGCRSAEYKPEYAIRTTLANLAPWCGTSGFRPIYNSAGGGRLRGILAGSNYPGLHAPPPAPRRPLPLATIPIRPAGG